MKEKEILNTISIACIITIVFGFSFFYFEIKDEILKGGLAWIFAICFFSIPLNIWVYFRQRANTKKRIREIEDYVLRLIHKERIPEKQEYRVGDRIFNLAEIYDATQKKGPRWKIILETIIKEMDKSWGEIENIFKEYQDPCCCIPPIDLVWCSK